MPSSPPLPLPLEKDFQRTVTDLLTVRSWLWYHTRKSKGSKKGFPDIVAIRVRDRRRIWIELKRSEREKRTPEQIVWAESLLAVGEEYHCWEPSQWDEIQTVLW